MSRFLLSVCFILLCFEVAQARDFYVVSVGVADYPGEENDLNLPVNDATALAVLYKKCENANAVLMTNQKATRANVVKTISYLFGKAKEDDVIIFFFSGHGINGNFVLYDTYLSFKEIRNLYSSCKAKHKIIFADACFSGNIAQGGGSIESTDFDADVMLFLSSRSDEVSIERQNMKNGYFTACLVNSLYGAADKNGDKTITAIELFEGVRNGVIKLSNDRQHPVMWGNFDADMPVVSWN